VRIDLVAQLNTYRKIFDISAGVLLDMD